MGGIVRMNGITHNPADNVPVVHRPGPGADLAKYDELTNRPKAVVYDKDGIVRSSDAVKPQVIGTVEKPVQYVPAYSSQYYSDKSATPQVTNAKTVSTETAAEARAAAKARKAKAK